MSKAFDVNVYKKLTERFGSKEEDIFFPSGSVIIDTVVSSGKGIPLGSLIEFSSDSGVGKCVTGDTLVCLDGILAPIETFFEGLEEGFNEVEMITPTPNGMDKVSHLYKENTGDDLYRIFYGRGREIKVTGEHPLRVVTSNLEVCWKKAKDIRLGDKLIQRRGFPSGIKKDRKSYLRGFDPDREVGFGTEEEVLNQIAGIVDYYGCMSETRFVLCVEDKTVVDFVEKVFYYYGLDPIREVIGVEESDNYRLSLGREDTQLLRGVLVNLMASGECRGDIKEIEFPNYTQLLKVDKEVLRDIERQLGTEIVGISEGISSESLIGSLLSTAKGRERFGELKGHTLQEVNCIQRIPPETVYDLTNPDSQMFYANGIVSHNSTILLHIARCACAMGKRVIYLDPEAGVNDSQLEGIGLSQYMGDKFLYYAVQTFEDLEDVIQASIEDPELVYVIIDSITSTVPGKLLEKDRKISDIEPGLHARYAALFYQKYKPLAKNHKVTFFFVNQTRIKLDFRRGGVEQAAGGSAQRFYMDARLFFRQTKKLEKTVMTASGKQAVPYGSEATVWTIKNRYARPFVPLDITVLFGRGVSNIASYRDWLIRNELIVQGGGGYFTIKVDGGEEKVRGYAAVDSWVGENIKKVKEIIQEGGGFELVE